MKPLYHRWLRRDLDRWVANGWVSADGAKAIRAEIQPRQSFVRLQTLMAMLGAVLLVFAAITFVAANWQEISRLSRLGLLLGAMWASFTAGGWLHNSRWPWLTGAAILTGLGLFGASIVLIAQMYHIDGRYPDALLLWTLGALLTAALLWSRAALTVALIAMTIWTGTEVLDFQTPFHWPFLLTWAVALILVWTMRWRFGVYLAMTALAFFLLITLISFAKSQDWPFIGATLLGAEAVLAFAMLAFFIQQKDDGRRFAPFDPETMSRLGTIAIVLFLLLLFVMQLGGSSLLNGFAANLGFSGPAGWSGWALIFFALALITIFFLKPSPRFHMVDKLMFSAAGTFAFLLAFFAVINVWIFGAFYLALALGIAAFGQHRQEAVLVNLGIIAFGAEVLFIYFKLFATMMQTSLFFLVGGMLLIGLALGLPRLSKLFRVKGARLL